MGVINVDNLGSSSKICKFPECVRRSWPGHLFCGKQHADQFKRDFNLAATIDSGLPYVARHPACKFPSPRKFFQQSDSGWVNAGSAYGNDDNVDGAAPPLPQPGGRLRQGADPSAVIAGLSTEWTGWRRGDPAKALL